MKIVLFFDLGQYKFRSYYREGQGENKNINIDGEKHIKNNNGILLLDSLLSAFNEQKVSNESIKDIEEIEFIINTSGNFRIGNSSGLEKLPIIIKHKHTNAISLTIDSNIRSLDISGGKINGLLIQDVSTRNIICSEVSFEGFVKVLGCNITTDLIFERCNMSEEDGKNIHLELDNSNISTLVINRTEFFKITSTDTRIASVFPYKITFGAIETKGSQPFLRILPKFKKLRNTASEIKDYYRQLKHSHDEIGNKTEANKFFAKEMEYYEKSLSWSDWDKKLISFIQHYSNNYGNSWLGPLIWIIVVSFLYTYLSDCWDFKCTCGGVQDWHCFQSHWLKNVSQFPTELKNAKDWWFLLYAIIMGSLFYQLLVALRRISQR